MSAAETLSRFVHEIAFDDIPGEVVESAKLHLMDTLGCGIAAHALDQGTHARRVMWHQGGAEEAVAMGSPVRLPAPNAAFANATLCHALDFDDTHGDAGCHVGVVVAPSALAAAQASDAAGRETIVAYVLGSETILRIGMAAPRAFHRRGFHPTSVCGVFGAAAATAKLSELGLAATTSALGLAGSFPAGNFAYLNDGTPTKPLNPGIAAHGGMLAVRLAEEGAVGPASILEGRYGFYATYADAEMNTIAEQVADLGTRWETPITAFKAYPACHAMHGCLGAAEQLMRPRPPVAEIERIVVSIADPDIPLVLEPLDQKIAPRTPYEAKFSLPFSIAALLVHGSLGLDSYLPPALVDEDVRSLARRVSYEHREFRTHPATYPGAVRLELVDGTTLEVALDHPPGSAMAPLGREAIVRKFTENAAMALTDRDVIELTEALSGLEEETDLRSVAGPLSRLRTQSTGILR
jgi:2-methylcitrate dehydratase PrpD